MDKKFESKQKPSSGREKNFGKEVRKIAQESTPPAKFFSSADTMIENLRKSGKTNEEIITMMKNPTILKALGVKPEFNEQASIYIETQVQGYQETERKPAIEERIIEDEPAIVERTIENESGPEIDSLAIELRQINERRGDVTKGIVEGADERAKEIEQDVDDFVGTARTIEIDNFISSIDNPQKAIALLEYSLEKFELVDKERKENMKRLGMSEVEMVQHDTDNHQSYEQFNDKLADHLVKLLDKYDNSNELGQYLDSITDERVKRIIAQKSSNLLKDKQEGEPFINLAVMSESHLFSSDSNKLNRIMEYNPKFSRIETSEPASPPKKEKTSSVIETEAPLHIQIAEKIEEDPEYVTEFLRQYRNLKDNPKFEELKKQILDYFSPESRKARPFRTGRDYVKKMDKYLKILRKGEVPKKGISEEMKKKYRKVRRGF